MFSGIAKGLGYQIDTTGLCLGFATLGMQAIIIEDLATFDHRNKLIRRKVEQLTVDGFVGVIKEIEEKRVKKLGEYREQLLEGLIQEYEDVSHSMTDDEFRLYIDKNKKNPLVVTFNELCDSIDKALPVDEQKKILNEYRFDLIDSILDFTVDYSMTDQAFYLMLEAYKEHPLVIEYRRLRDSVDLTLSLEEQSFVDIRTYIQLMAFYEEAHTYSILFGENTGPSHQTVYPALMIGLPDQLLTTEVKEEKKEENDMTSITKKSLVKKVTVFAGLYNETQLVSFFNQLRLATSSFTPPVCFLLRSGRHAVTVSYDSRIPCWNFIDIKRMTLSRRKSDIDIAKKLLLSFSKNNVTTFRTEVYCHQRQENAVAMSLYELTQSDAWESLHRVDTKKAHLADSHGATLLYIAIRNGDIDLVKKILELNINLNEAQFSDYPLIVLAAERGHANIIEEFLRDKNLNINIQSDRGYSALYAAVFNNHVSVVKTLLNDNEHKLNPFLPAADGSTPFFAAIEKGRLEIVKLFIEKYPVQKLKPSMCMEVSTLLYHADLKNRKEEVFNMLFEKTGGARELHGFSPFHAAIFFGDLEMVKTLIAAGFDVNQKTADGVSGLDFAMAMNRVEIIEELKITMASQLYRKLNLKIDSDEIKDYAIGAISQADFSMFILAEGIYQKIKQLQISEKYKTASPENKKSMMKMAIDSAKLMDHSEMKQSQFNNSFLHSLSRRSANVPILSNATQSPALKTRKK